ncbi:hypothetical protein B0H19DRAFT_1245688 [Mycena capillaripes]|nr:hypothetical protein B0H19DRAFT_1245688 [Mycena capillaripes]
MVPTIPSGTLPQTPANEWADGMNDLISGHVTRTPVGTPGPAVPGAFPSHLEPDPVPNSTGTANDASMGAHESLFATAQSFLPTLATAKAYLPQGVAAYLPSSETLTTPASESSLPPLPPSSSSLSSTSTLPRQDSSAGTYFPSTDPDPSRTATGDSAALSTRAHTGHSSSAIPPPSPSAIPPRPASGLIPAHPGVARDSQSAFTHDSGPQVQSPLPQELADADSGSSPRPRATSGLLPSHPAAPGAAQMHAQRTHALQGPVLTPTPTPTPADLSTPSLVHTASTGGDSGYAASTETELATPGSGPLLSPPVAAPEMVPSYAQQPAYGAAAAAPGAGLQGSSALNSSRVVDNVPTGDFDAPSGEGEGDAPMSGVQGSTALNSSQLADNVPRGDLNAPPKETEGDAPTLGVQGSAALNSSQMADNVPTSDLSDVSGQGSSDGDGVVGGGEDQDADAEEGDAHAKGKGKGKKPKLLQRLKEKMHVGHGSA